MNSYLAGFCIERAERLAGGAGERGGGHVDSGSGITGWGRSRVDHRAVFTASPAALRVLAIENCTVVDSKFIDTLFVQYCCF